MEPDQTIKLVAGTFSPQNATDVLFSLINDKIKFHQLQILSLKTGINADVYWSKQRIAILKDSKDKVENLILKARNEGYKLQVEGDITIKLIKTIDEA